MQKQPARFTGRKNKPTGIALPKALRGKMPREESIQEIKSQLIELIRKN